MLYCENWRQLIGTGIALGFYKFKMLQFVECKQCMLENIKGEKKCRGGRLQHVKIWPVYFIVSFHGPKSTSSDNA